MSAINRDDLYEQVWREPMVAVAARLGVSSSYLGRVCRQLRVPRPRRGYWAKQKSGAKLPSRPPLPAVRPGDPIEWNPGVALSDPLDDVVRESTSRVRKAAEHAIVREARAQFQRAREKGPDPLRPTSHGYLRPWKQTLLDLIVSPDLLDRALRIANEMIRGLETRGHRVVLGRQDQPARRIGPAFPAEFERRLHHAMWWPCVPTVTIVNDVAIGFTVLEPPHEIRVRLVNDGWIPLREQDDGARVARGRRVDNDWSISTRWVPSGRLEIRFYGAGPFASWSKSWPSPSDEWSEAKASEIALELEQAAPEIAAAMAAAKRKHDEEVRRRDEAERVRKEREQLESRRRAATRSRVQLLELARGWVESREISEFLDAARAELESFEAGDRHRLARRIDLAQDLLGDHRALATLERWDPTPFDDEEESADP